MSFPIFTGNCPKSVSKEAKYTVRSGKNGPVVGIVYASEDDERWYATSEEHPKLVQMVNNVKREIGGVPNGSFYINEYHQVIVPLSGKEEYYYAGKFEEPLRFKFEEKILSGEPFDLQGNPISPGEDWVGPHPGIPYVLKAGGKDIFYKYSPRPNVVKKVFLSKKIGPEGAGKTAAKISMVKGYAGGRFYVNEFGYIFAPLQEGGETQYKYIGKIVMTQWFPKPEV